MFNKETEYALRALVHIRSRNLEGHRPGVAETASATGTPHFFIAKILQRLVRSGFLRSVKGKGGGFYFDGNGEDVPLSRLLAATGSEWSETSCGFGLERCDDKNPCPLHERYAPIRDAINNMVSEETISSLARKKSNRGKK